MEESLKIDAAIRERFAVGDVDVHTYSPLTLAFIGDSIYDLIVRTLVVGRGNTKPAKLHRASAEIVRAPSQARMMDVLELVLTEEEEQIFRRGRNANPHTTAKNASIADYRRATGFEALLGYLYLTDRMNRIFELLEIGWREDKDHA